MKNNYYQKRINQVLGYMNEHLADPIRIEELARISHFSPFHFQRIYKALQEETPYETILRLRLEKSIFFLQYQKEHKIAEIAFACGFPSVENFTRQFKARFKLTPSAFRKDKKKQNSRIYQENHPEDFYHCIVESRKEGEEVFGVTLENLGAIPISFIRAWFGADGSGLVESYQELIDWAITNDLPWQGPMKRFGRSMDSPEVTPASKYRYDFAISTPDNPPLSGLIERGEIPAGLYATIHCVGDLSTVAKAWDFLYKHWLPNSEYVPLHYPAMEEFIKGPEEIGWERFDLKCRIPIVKISKI